MALDPALARTRDAAAACLLSMRTPHGHWEGELSSSALSTATAVFALAMVGRRAATTAAPGDERLVRGGLAWLARHQNADGGWGDTTDSPSNVSTTTLVWVALAMGDEAVPSETTTRAEVYLGRAIGALTSARFAEAFAGIYGADRTFAVPILATCALGGRFGEGREAWAPVPPLPFELAALPHQLFSWLGLSVVSYALPALIAIGRTIHHHHPSRNPLTRAMRHLALGTTLRKLRAIQPETGGFLEATPLTSFVIGSLAGCGLGDDPVVRRGADFLRRSVRSDGSWPIDTNLATWLTSLAIGALAGGGRLDRHLDPRARTSLAAWLTAQQFRAEHPYTHAAPGGWAWTDLAGGVPDADDTPAALLALRALGGGDPTSLALGVRWLVDVQNRDGGIPTFCRGWGRLPFDQSCSDLTAHALRCWGAWEGELEPRPRRAVHRAQARAAAYLHRAQRPDGSWVPLWFGNQHTATLENPLYGTTRVLRARGLRDDEAWRTAMRRGVAWVLAAQADDGGWGGEAGAPPSVEETALAVEALCDAPDAARHPGLPEAVARGARWLVVRTEEGTRFEARPIGLYFARLWYSERLYPLLFAVSALERAVPLLRATDGVR